MLTTENSANIYSETDLLALLGDPEAAELGVAVLLVGRGYEATAGEGRNMTAKSVQPWRRSIPLVRTCR